MRVDKELVERIATNARLELSEDEGKKIIPQLQEVFDIFSSLEEVETEDKEVALHPIPLEADPREDREMDCLTQEEALSNSEHTKDGFFRGPKTL